MRPELEKYYLIDQFLRGELVGEELALFNSKIDTNPSFAKEVDCQKNVNELITVHQYHHLREQMTREIDNIDKKNNLKKWFGAAIIIGIIITSGLFLLTFDKQTSDKSPSVIIEKTPQEDSKEEISSNTDNKEEQEKINLTDSIKPAPSNPLHKNGKGWKEEKESEIITHDSVNPILYSKKEKIVAVNIENTSKKKSQTKDTTEVSTVHHNPCTSVTLETDWEVVPTCKGDNDGQIRVKETVGGMSPYKLELEREGIKKPGSVYYHLSSGDYTLNVTDASGCSRSWEIEVLEKACYLTQHSIAPDYGETWKYHSDKKDSYYLSILNQSGQLIFKSALTNGDFEWKGVDQTGAALGSGLYIYIIEYTNGEKENGQITILR